MVNAAAGWYPVDDGRLRYWDGEAWTDHFHAGTTTAGSPIRQAGAAAVNRLIDTSAVHDPEAVWQSTGRPLTGIGAGRYRLTHHYLFFEKGALRTDSQQVPISAVVDVDVRQSMSQKARGVFTVLVHIQRAQGIEIVTMDDIPDGREAQRLINDTAHQARLAIQQRTNTHRYENTHLVGHVGQLPGIQATNLPAPNVPAALPPGGPGQATETDSDPIEQLRRLGELRDAGIVTDEEFAAKKAEMLRRL